MLGQDLYADSPDETSFTEAMYIDLLQAAAGKPVLCYSTTSVYQVDTPGQLVDEATPLRATPRSSASPRGSR